MGKVTFWALRRSLDFACDQTTVEEKCVFLQCKVKLLLDSSFKTQALQFIKQMLSDNKTESVNQDYLQAGGSTFNVYVPNSDVDAWDRFVKFNGRDQHSLNARVEILKRLNWFEKTIDAKLELEEKLLVNTPKVIERTRELRVKVCRLKNTLDAVLSSLEQKEQQVQSDVAPSRFRLSFGPK